MRRRWVKVSAVVLVAIALLAGVVLLQYGIDSQQATARGSTATAPRDTAQSILDLLGGVRETLAAVLWTKTDEIWHGYFGEDLTKEPAIFSYFWMITRLDPHYTDAYYFASWMLCRFGKPKQGFDLALEGVRNNPDSEIMQKNLADIYLFYIHDMPKAKYHLEKALKLVSNSGSNAVGDTDKSILERELSTVEMIQSGERKVPKNLMTIYKERQLNKEAFEKLHKD